MEPETSTSPTPGVRRRTLIGSAWAAPVILAAVAAPAAVASGTSPLRVRFNNFSVFESGAGMNLSVSKEFSQTGTVSSVTVDVYLPQSGYTGAFTAFTGTGWTAVAVGASGTSFIIRFTYSTPLTASGSTSTMAFRPTKKSPFPAGLVVNATVQGVDGSTTTPVATASATA